MLVRLEKNVHCLTIENKKKKVLKIIDGRYI